MAAGWNRTPQEKLDKAAALLAEGKTRTEVQEAIGVSHVTMAKYFPKGRDWKVWGQEKIDRVGAMLEEGMSHRAIELELGCSKNTILKYFPDSAWSRQQCVEHASDIRKLNSIRVW